MKILLIVIAISVFVFACVGTSSISVSDVDGKAKGVEKTISASSLGILHLTSPDTAKLDVAKKLAAQCQGELKNVNVTLQMREWLVVQYYDATATATCVTSK